MKSTSGYVLVKALMEMAGMQLKGPKKSPRTRYDGDGKHKGMSAAFFTAPRPQFPKSRQVERREFFLMEARAETLAKRKVRAERQLLLEKRQGTSSNFMTVVRRNIPLVLKGARV